MSEEQENPASSGPLRLRVTPTAEWKLRSGHPWLFSDSILEQSRAGRAGDLAVIYDRYDNFLAIGLYDPDSPIRVRIVHKGKPRSIDAEFWRAKLAEAMQLRQKLFDDQTTGYRILHGENDGFPGLVLDRYGDTLVLKIYTTAWLVRLAEITGVVREHLAPQRVVLRLSRNVQQTARGTRFHFSDGQVIHGEPLAGPVTFLESGLRFEADVLRGQKTGFFLDQRENRRLVESLAKGRDVLNVFSFAGGFSVYAARGGATSTTDVDISEHALESAKRNFELNAQIPEVANCRREFIQADAFKWFQQSAKRGDLNFDLIVLDPPSLAKRESERAGAIPVYEKLAESAMRRLREGGILVCSSCSAHVSKEEFFGAVREAARGAARKFEEIRTTGHAADHPAIFLEAQYLKTIYMRF